MAGYEFKEGSNVCYSNSNNINYSSREINQVSVQANPYRPLINYDPLLQKFTYSFCYSSFGKNLQQYGPSDIRIVLRKNRISIGCSDITIEAARKIIAEYEKKFGEQPEEYVLQP